MTKRFNKKITDKQPSQTVTISVQQQIERNKNVIFEQISGSNIARLNNLNWIRHEIAFSEPKTLFQKPAKEQPPFFNYTCSKGLGAAYDYILDKKNNELTTSGIRDIHYLICQGTNIRAGVYRQYNNIIDISIEGVRIHAPDEYNLPSLMEQTVFEYNESTKPDTMRAFDLHYQLIVMQPFEDCNKRTARIVMNWALVLSGYYPIMFNRKSDKANYIRAIKDMATGDSKSYYKYMYDCMKHSQQQIIKQLNRSKIR